MSFKSFKNYTSFTNNNTRSNNKLNLIDTTGIKYYYSFDNESYSNLNVGNFATGSYVYDASMSSTNSANLISSSTQGIVGNGNLVLDASFSQFIKINSPIITTTNGLSFSCWFKANNTGENSRIFDFGNGENNNNILVLFNSGIYFFVFKNGVPTSRIISTSFNNNVIYFLTWTLTYDEGNSSIWTIYINGNILMSTTGSYPLTTVSRLSNFIGRSNWTSDAYFTGSIDDFRMYNRVITASEVLILYNNK